MSVRGFIDINQYSYNRGKKTATIKWAHRYGNTDAAFVMQILENSVNEQKKVRNVIKRFNRRFG